MQSPAREPFSRDSVFSRNAQTTTARPYDSLRGAHGAAAGYGRNAFVPYLGGAIEEWISPAPNIHFDIAATLAD